jgi:glutaredoxin 3
MANKRKIVIYSSPWCGYCAAAKALLKDKNQQFEDIDVSMDKKLRAELVERTGRRTVPQIFIGDESIGGYDELHALDQSGELDRLLTKQ